MPAINPVINPKYIYNVGVDYGTGRRFVRAKFTSVADAELFASAFIEQHKYDDAPAGYPVVTVLEGHALADAPLEEVSVYRVDVSDRSKVVRRRAL